jgi:type IV fimbrial biogenesis protein FimT
MKTNRGLTLLECLLVISISLILLLSASIAYREFVHHNQLSTLVNNFTDALNYARDEAITKDMTITLCPKNAENNCGSDWQQGQLILDKDKHVLRILPSMPKQYHLSWRSTLGDSNHLQWRSDGFTRGQQGSFFICATKGRSARLIILRTGRLRVMTGKIPGCD